MRRLVLLLTLLAPLRIATAASTPLELALVLQNPGDVGSEFGQAVAAVGPELLIGAPGNDSNLGAAYLYAGSDGQLLRTFSNPITWPSGAGRSVAVNSDSIIVGAPSHPEATCCGTDGVVHLFDAPSGQLQRTIAAPNVDFGGFGLSVAGNAGTVLTGAPEDRFFAGFGRGGVAYLFDGATGALLRIIDNPDPEFGAGFGTTVAATADGLFVAAPSADAGGVDAGAVYVFDPSGKTVLRVLHNPDPDLTHYFGAAIAARGTKVLIGAPDLERRRTEAAYLFDLESGRLLRRFRNPTGAPGNRFGLSVALLGSDVVVGAPGAFPDAVFLFDARSGALLQTLAYPLPPPEHSFPLFGSSLATVGKSLLVGAPNADAGRAFLYVRACGDGKVTAGERCDDGNRAAGDGCSAACRLESCGDGVVCAGEECDDGDCRDGDGCDSNCTATRCGNGVVTAGEECDDGNASSGDGCDENCTLSACGNGVVAYFETCDDGNRVGGDGCSAWCSVEACGNGVGDAGESCEQGSLVACDAECRLEEPLGPPFVLGRLAFESHGACWDCDYPVGKLVRVGARVAVGMRGTPRGSAILFDVGTGDPIRILEPPPPFGDSSYGQALAVVADELLVGEPGYVHGGAWGFVHVFDAKNGTYRRTIASPVPDEKIFGSAIAALGSDALIAGTTVSLIDVHTGGLIRTFQDLPPRASFPPYALAALGPDVLVGGDGVVHLLDGLTGARRHVFGTEPSYGPPTVVVLDDDVLIGGHDAVDRYDGATGALVRSYPGYENPLAAANGMILLSDLTGCPGSFFDGPAGHLLDAETGAVLEVFCVDLGTEDPIFAGALVDDVAVIGQVGGLYRRPIFTTFAPCTDGVLVPGEECDDGNRMAGDGCEPDCRLPRAPTSTSTTLAPPATTTSTAVTPEPTTTTAPAAPPFGACRNPGLSRVEVLRCLLSEGALRACSDVELPEGVIRRLERARASLARADASAGTNRARRLLTNVRRTLRRAGTLTERAGRRGKLPSACMAALRDAFGAVARESASTR